MNYDESSLARAEAIHFRAPEQDDAELEAAAEEIEDKWCREVDSIQDWIAGECYLKPEQEWSPSLNHREADFSETPIPQLLALVFDAGQPARTVAAAAFELRERYVKSRQEKQ
jgi:hypothetical protein